MRKNLLDSAKIHASWNVLKIDFLLFPLGSEQCKLPKSLLAREKSSLDSWYLIVHSCRKYKSNGRYEGVANSPSSGMCFLFAPRFAVLPAWSGLAGSLGRLKLVGMTVETRNAVKGFIRLISWAYAATKPGQFGAGLRHSNTHQAPFVCLRCRGKRCQWCEVSAAVSSASFPR